MAMPSGLIREKPTAKSANRARDGFARSMLAPIAKDSRPDSRVQGRVRKGDSLRGMLGGLGEEAGACSLQRLTFVSDDCKENRLLCGVGGAECDAFHDSVERERDLAETYEEGMAMGGGGGG